MTTLKYKGKCIRMHEDTWKLLKERRMQSGLSWNLFLLKLLGRKKISTAPHIPIIEKDIQ